MPGNHDYTFDAEFYDVYGKEHHNPKAGSNPPSFLSDEIEFFRALGIQLYKDVPTVDGQKVRDLLTGKDARKDGVVVLMNDSYVIPNTDIKIYGNLFLAFVYPEQP